MSDTFIDEILLKAAPDDLAGLDVRLGAARQLCNACLRESLRRLKLMRESKQYQSAGALAKGKPGNAAFKAALGQYQFQEYSRHTFAVQTKNAWWTGDHLDVLQGSQPRKNRYDREAFLSIVLEELRQKRCRPFSRKNTAKTIPSTISAKQKQLGGLRRARATKRCLSCCSPPPLALALRRFRC